MTPKQDVAGALAGETITTSYRGIEFEGDSPSVQHYGERRKTLHHFGESLTRLRERGFERHPRPAEVYGLIIDRLEGKLSPMQLQLYADIFVPFALRYGSEHHLYCGEFLSLAVDLEADGIQTYLDPEGLTYHNHYGGYYTKGPNFTCAESRRFRIVGKRDRGPLGLEEMENSFVEYICGRRYEELPIEMREGPNKIRIFTGLGVLPVSFGTGANKPTGIYDIVTFYDRGSRGVREAQEERRFTIPSHSRDFTW